MDLWNMALPAGPGPGPIMVLDIELGLPLAPIPPGRAADGRPYRGVSALVWLSGRPVGALDLALPAEGLTAEEVAEAVWRALGDAIGARLRAEGRPAVCRMGPEGLGLLSGPAEQGAEDHAGTPFASVVVATRERPAELAGCVEALLALDYPAFEIIVVDNAEGESATAALIRSRYGADRRVRYLREERRGASLARNHGLAAARGAIVAFTDDDVRVDRRWLRRLVAGFSAAPNVACVTGLIVPAELETPAQIWFEQFGGFSKGYERRVFDMGPNRPPGRLFPYTVGMFGASASMAVRPEAVLRAGGFDPALGPGTPTLGGEDLALYFELLRSGHSLVYEPAAVARHIHRRDEAALRRQLYGYGMGLSACLTRCVAVRPGRLLEVALRAGAGLGYALSPTSPKNARKAPDYPPELSRIELRGMLAGPLAYLRSRLIARDRGRREPAPALQPE